MRVTAMLRQLFEKHSEHKERETQSDCDQQKSATYGYNTFENCWSFTFPRYALPQQAVDYTHESEDGNRQK